VKREAQFQTLFKRWLQAKWEGGPAVFELKRTIGNSLPFSAVKPHQEEALTRARDVGLYYKIPDDSFSQKPFDCFYVKNVGAYLVIGFGERLKSFVMIPIERWLTYKKLTKRQSITKEQAEGLADYVIHW
jgi:penicillin-binding protein-related factor A (putative recombinase)